MLTLPRLASPGLSARRASTSIRGYVKIRYSITSTKVPDDGSWTAFEAVVYVKAWKRKARVVIRQHYNAAGEFSSHATLVFTDLEQGGADLILSYTSRFQQEFFYRDAKQELGLEDCQAYTWSKIDFHLNASLTTVVLAKAAHCLEP